MDVKDVVVVGSHPSSCYFIGSGRLWGPSVLIVSLFVLLYCCENVGDILPDMLMLESMMVDVVDKVHVIELGALLIVTCAGRLEAPWYRVFPFQLARI